MKKSFKKAIAVLLAVLMVVCSFPFSAIAAGLEEKKPNINLKFGAFYYNVNNNRQEYTNTQRTNNVVTTFASSGLASANLDYNDGTLTDPTNSHVYGVGDYFTASVVIENVSKLAATDIAVKYSSNLTPAGALNARGAVTSGGTAGYVVGEAITSQSGNALYNKTSTLGELSAIDAANHMMLASFAVQDGTDYVDTTTTTIGSQTYTNTAVIATYAFYVNAAGPITFSLGGTSDNVDDAYCVGALTVDATGNAIADPDETKQYVENNAEESGLDFMAKGEEEAPHEHSYTWVYNDDSVYTSSTNYKDGTATGTCECGDVQTKTIEGTGLLRANTASVTLGAAVVLSVGIDKSREAKFADTYCKFEFQGKEYTLGSTDKVQGATSTRWQYDFDKIAPQYFADDVTITMYGVTEDGIVCKGHSVNYSVLKYCTTQLGKAANGNNLKKLLTEILYYGEMDRIYRKNTVSASPIAGLSATDMARHTTDVPTYVNAQNATFATVDNPTLVWKSISLDILGAVRPMFRFEIPAGDNLDDYTFDIDVDGVASTMSSVTDPDAFVAYTGAATSGKKSYYIYVDKVKAYQFNLPFTIVANKNGAAVSNTVQYSVESYATKTAYKNGTADLKNLVDQMLRYGRANATWANDKNG